MPKKAKPSAKIQTEQFLMRTSKEFLQKVDEWRATQRPIPSRAEAIRICTEAGIEVRTPKEKEIAAGLEAEAAKKGKKR